MWYVLSFLGGVIFALLIQSLCLASSHRDDRVDDLNKLKTLENALDEACNMLAHDGKEPSAYDWKKYLIDKYSPEK